MLWLLTGQGGKLKSTCWWSWTGLRDLYGFVTNTLMTLYLQIHETRKTYWDVRNRLDSNFKRRLRCPTARAGTMKPEEPLKVANFAWVCMGLADGVMGTATCSQGLASDRSLVNKMPYLLQTLTGNLSGCTWFWLQDRIFVYQSDQRETSFFSVSNSWCVHPKLRCTSVSFSATRLGGWDISYLLSWVLGSTPYLALFHGFLIWFHWFHCACWLVSLRWFDIIWCHAFISGCWDWREQAEKGSWYSIQARCGFLNWLQKWENWQADWPSFFFIIMGISEFD